MYFIIMPVRRMQNAAIQCVLYLKSSFVWNPFIHTHAVWDCISQELNQAWKIHFSPPRNPGQTTERSEEGWRDVSPLLLCTPPSLSHPKWRKTIALAPSTKRGCRGQPVTQPLSFCVFFSMRLAAQSACRGPWHSNGNTKALSSLFMGPLTALKSSCQGPARSQLVNVPAGGGSCHPAQRRSSLYGSLRPPWVRAPPPGPSTGGYGKLNTLWGLLGAVARPAAQG